MNGIEKLRNVMEHWRTGSLVDWCRGVAYQIEREHLDAMNERAETICELNREIAQLRAELADSKRDMTDEARETVERLRNLGENPDFFGLSSAVAGSTLYSYGEVRDRLIELIEHGGKQYVDVVGLQGLSDKIDACASYLGHGGCADLACNMSDAAEDMFGIDEETNMADARVMLETIAERIRMAIDGAPKHSNIVALCKPCRTMRAAAADWVEQQGGLDVVRDYPKMDEFVAKLAIDLGVSDDIGCGDDLRLAISEELDKRLMPPGMTWPRFEDGKRIVFGDKCRLGHVHDEPVDIDVFGFMFVENGIHLLDDISEEYQLSLQAAPDSFDTPYERPEPEVLGADGKPIKVGETVYALQGEDPLIVSGYDGEFLKIKSGGLLRADYATHTPPDTQERIDEDAKKDTCEYFHTTMDHCGDCRLFDCDCEAEFRLDLLRRQRELDAKMGGDAS